MTKRWAFAFACIVLCGAQAMAAPLQIRDDLQQARDVLVQGHVTVVIGGSSRPLRGASVELERLEGDAAHRTVAAVVTDANGYYAVTNPAGTTMDVSAGTYRLYASYRTTRKGFGTINVSAGETLTRDLALGAMEPIGGAAPPTPSAAFFATDRLPSAGATTLQKMFANGRLVDPCTAAADCMMSYGTVEPNGPFLKATKASSVDDLVAKMRAMPQFSNAASVLVFVHGYNNDFFGPLDIGATWLSAFDVNQPVIVYSWASNDTTIKYLDDETNNTWGMDHFRDFMLALLNAPNAPRTVNIFAHSMGNRLAVNFLDYLAAAKPVTHGKIGQAIFAAPDVDSATFFEDVPKIATVAQGLTMYGSDHDNALRASRTLHGHCRAGLVGCDYAVPNVPNFNAIDASMFHCDVLGHGYWLSSDTLRTDIVELLKSGVMQNGALRPNLSAGSVPSSYVFTSAVPSDKTCESEAI